MKYIPSYGLGVRFNPYCGFDTRSECLNNWGCMWCNSTNINISGNCNKFSVCTINETNYPKCELSSYNYESECDIISFVFYTLIISVFIMSISILLYTNNKLSTDAEIINQANKYLNKYSLKDVVELISKKEKISKKKVYEICLKIKKNEKKYN